MTKALSRILAAMAFALALLGVVARARGGPASASSASSASSARPAPSSSAPAPAVVGIGAEVPKIPDTLPPTSSYEGKPIVSVAAKVRGSLWTTPPSLKGPRAGEALHVELARAELSRILAEGGFASGALEVTDASGGVAVVYRLVPARFVRRVAFHGNVLPDDDVRRAAGLADLPDVTESSLDGIAQAIARYYAHRGYADARVEIVAIESDLPFTVVLDVRIEPGLGRTIDTRTFVGLPSWDAEAMAAARAYAVTPGSRADEEQLDAADRELAGKLRAAGFVNATVTHATSPSKAAGEGRLALSIEVVAGSKIVPSFEGNQVFDASQLGAVLDLKSEPDRSPYHLASKIESAYQRRGYLDVRVTPELLGKVEDARRTLLFRVREGRIVTVSKRVYPCLHGALDAKRLDREIDSYLDEDLESGGFGEIDPAAADALISDGGDVARGARPAPVVPHAHQVFVPETYARALDHLRELYKSEGYIFVVIGEPRLVRAACRKSSPPGQCILEPIPTLPDVCQRDADQLPLEPLPYPKSVSCSPDPLAAATCASTMIVSIPVEPGPRSLLWDVAFDGALQVTPAKLGSSDVAGGVLRMGEPLSLNDVEAARQKVVDYYKDEGYAFASVKATIEYSPDKSRARVRYLVSEGEQVVIDDIRIDGLVRTRESLVLERILLVPGGIYRAKRVRDSIDRLGKLGVFSSVSIGLANPTIPAKRKTVVVALHERDANSTDLGVGFSSGEGVRASGEYTYNNIFGYAVAFTLRAKVSYQPFLFPGLYDPEIISQWEALRPVDRLARRISAGFTIPQTPILGPVRTTIEFVNVLDLERDFLLNKITPVLTFAWEPVRWFYATLSSDVESNRFQLLNPNANKALIGVTNPTVQALLRVPDGDTMVAAQRLTVTFDWRDIRLGATKGGFVSLTSEWVKSLYTQPQNDPTLPPNPRQDFLHLSAAAGAYVRLFDWSPNRPVVLAFELGGGLDHNVFSCNGEGADSTACNTYPDRLFYIGGPDTSRGYQLQQMLPQEELDELVSQVRQLPQCQPGFVPPSSNPPPSCADTIAAAPHGGTVYINPRVELRVPAFPWGGFVLFVDAANVWRDPANFTPWKLRYAVGPGLSIDTPIGPVAFDVGFNIKPVTSLDEPTWTFNFAIGRF